MAELVVTMAIRSLVSMLKDKASSYVLDQYNVMEGMEEQHKTLKRKLPAILDVITDAEEQATAHREGAKAWLEELKTVAYQANEVFDEFKYEALRRQAKKNGHYGKLGFDAIKLFPTHNRVAFRNKMGRKLCQILQAVEVLIAEMHAFRFKYRPQPLVPKEWRQTNYVIADPQEIASRSREKDKTEVVGTLLRQANNGDLAVVAIVGMGGLGKTTLAQLIYNEPGIQKHFQLLLWVCVSDTFDVNSLAKSIVEASPKKNDDTNKPPLERLQKLVSGQRYLLVLDDVWNREAHKWERLKDHLKHGGIGSAVLITTRDKGVAEIMGAYTHPLGRLDDRFLKEIIEAGAFSPEEKKPADLVKIVDQIVNRCRGSPLAASALGSVLRTKTSVKEWSAISSRSSICTEETGILPILKLSYNDLPSHMKQCFAFCALFPKDYKIDVAKLIQLWVANGFIPEQKEDSFETIGQLIFDELASRSFFLDIEESKVVSLCDSGITYYSRTTCKIHDLMHDIAMSVMAKECIVATKEPSEIEWLPDTTRHLFLSCQETEGILNDSMQKSSPTIQTLLCDCFMESPLQHLSKYSSLRALKFCIKDTKSFPLKPKYLHHLRYLDLSYSHIKALPEDLSILYSLQMLDLSNCFDLDRLPIQVKYMTSLRHLYTHGCPKLKSMPPELGKLTKLQTLTFFVAGVTGPDCSDVEELHHLNLGGQLELCQLETIDIDAEVKLTNLGKKKDLRGLTLRWSYVCESKEVLNNFEPHDWLQVLKIYKYGGKCMGMLQNMVEIHLFDCERIQFLFRCGTSFTFPKLKQLTLENLLDFERWWDINERKEEHIIFPVLEKLFIRHCGKLIALQERCGGGNMLVRSPFPALKVLELDDLASFQRWNAVKEIQGEQMLFPQLENLSIQKCPELTALPEAALLKEPCNGGYRLVRSAFPALLVLKMKDLGSFQRWDAAAEGGQILFPRLEKLSIKKCPKLIDLPEAPLLEEPCSKGYRLVRSPFSLLENLFIRYCEKVIALPEVPLLQEPCIGDCRFVRPSFPALKVLALKDLESLQRWDATAEGEQILFPQLEKLSVQKCPKIIDLPEAPKLSVLEIIGGKQEISHCVDRYFPSLTNLILKLENTETASEAECTSIVQVGSKEKWNQKSPITILELGCCNSFFGAGGLEPWDSFVHLERLEIDSCDVLFHWPEKAFQSLVSLRKLKFVRCRNLAGYAQAPLEQSTSERSQQLPGLESLCLQSCASLVEVFNVPASLKKMIILGCSKLEYIVGKQQGMPELVEGVSRLPSSPMNHLCPCLESLSLIGCKSLPEVLNLPPSLKNIYISGCRSIQVLTCQLGGLQRPEVTTSINVPEPSAAAARENSLPPCLQSLDLLSCHGMSGGTLRLPTSLKRLKIENNSGLTSLEFLVREHPPSLGLLWLERCSTLVTLPNEPQAYGSLQKLVITDCPAVKKLPRCLQQQLGSISSNKYLDARYEVMAFKPKTWKELLPRMVRERRRRLAQEQIIVERRRREGLALQLNMSR